jgi:hypothetical protein
MGITAPSSTVNIYLTTLSTTFTEKRFFVTDSNVKEYALENTLTPETDVVLLNGLYQIRGVGAAYQPTSTSIIFNTATILTAGDEIVVYFEKQL